MKMDPELKAKWVAALRSGEYVQGQGRLKTEDGYCCLGVLCVVAGLSFTPDGEGVASMSSELRCRWYDPIKDLLGDRNASGRLTSMNDDGPRRYPFPKIADWVEANL